MKKIILLDKKEGETPLEALERFRHKDKRYRDVSMTYAGRLDPMASGLLLILAGEEVRKKEKYLALGKVYEFEVLFGFATDTYDILGKVTAGGGLWSKAELEGKIKDNLKYFTGRFSQAYPLYSSKTVGGKPLFTYAREGRKVKVPEREAIVKELKFLKSRKISGKKLLENIGKRIEKVKGDFRQKEILRTWNRYLGKHAQKYFYIGSFTITCGSGTYVRSIADSLGAKMGLPALAYSIKRTKIGKFAKIR